MTRSRGGDFNYDTNEFACMGTEIDRFKTLADGFVFGILDVQRKVDLTKTAELVRRATAVCFPPRV